MSATGYKHNSITAPPSGYTSIGVNASGQAVTKTSDGTENIIGTSSESPSNIVSTKGVGLAANLPSSGFSAGDIYVSNDTYLVYTAVDGISWSSVALVKGQFITDVSDTLELPPLYQYYNSNLMPIANYVNEITLPE